MRKQEGDKFFMIYIKIIEEYPVKTERESVSAKQSTGNSDFNGD